MHIPQLYMQTQTPILHIGIHIHRLRHAHRKPCTCPHPCMHFYFFGFHICQTNIKYLPSIAVRIHLNETIH